MTLHVRLQPYQLPFVRPLATAVGTFHERRGFLVIVESAEQDGRGDAAPLPGFSEESLVEVERCLRAWHPTSPPSLDALDGSLPKGPPSARHGAEQALLAWMAAKRGTTVSRLLGAHDDTPRVAVNALVADAATARAAVGRGFHTLKTKVARASVAEDIDRVLAIREAVGPEVRIRLDANRGWSKAEATEALGALAEVSLELVEEPTGDLRDMAALRDLAPIGADESVRSEHDLDRVLAAGAADAVVVKPMLVGGLRASVRMMRKAAAHQVDTLVTTALESAVGRQGAAAVALAGPATLACGLDTGSWLAADVASGPRFEAGWLVEHAC